MNRERMERLHAALKKGIKGVRFDMAYWFDASDCETVGCIAGHAMLLHKEEMPKKYQAVLYRYCPATHAQKYLRLSPSVAGNLFDPDLTPTRLCYGNISRRAAAQAVQNVINGAKTAADIWRHLPTRKK